MASPRRLSRTSGMQQQNQRKQQAETDLDPEGEGEPCRAEHGAGGAAIEEIAHLKREEEPHEPGLDAGEAGEQIHARLEAEPARGGEVFEDRHRRAGHHGGEEKEQRQQIRPPQDIHLVREQRHQSPERRLVQVRQSHAEEHDRNVNRAQDAQRASPAELFKRHLGKLQERAH